jgi:hypothetical protein
VADFGAGAYMGGGGAGGDGGYYEWDGVYLYDPEAASYDPYEEDEITDFDTEEGEYADEAAEADGLGEEKLAYDDYEYSYESADGGITITYTYTPQDVPPPPPPPPADIYSGPDPAPAPAASDADLPRPTVTEPTSEVQGESNPWTANSSRVIDENQEDQQFLEHGTEADNFNQPATAANNDTSAGDTAALTQETPTQIDAPTAPDTGEPAAEAPAVAQAAEAQAADGATPGGLCRRALAPRALTPRPPARAMPRPVIPAKAIPAPAAHPCQVARVAWPNWKRRGKSAGQ